MAQNPFLWWLPSSPVTPEEKKQQEKKQEAKEPRKKAPMKKAPAAKTPAAKTPAAKTPAAKAPKTEPRPATRSAAEPLAKKPVATPDAAAPAIVPSAGAPLLAAPGHDRAGDLIRRAQQIAVALFLEECAAFDLTPVQYAVLSALRDNPGSDATRVGGLVAFDRTTISGVMERLEAKGLLARQTSAADKRIKTLTLTGDGRKLLKKAAPHVEQAQARILAPLSSAEQETLLALLGRLVLLNNDASRAPRRLPEAG